MSGDRKKRRRMASEAIKSVSGNDTPGQHPVVVYTDGACSGNPGPAGIGAVLEYKGKTRQISEYIGHATNNIAELEAVRKALLALKRRDLPVRLHTDSGYVHGLLTKNWAARKNTELVWLIRGLIREFARIEIVKVSGHSGIRGNEIADQLATSAIRNKKEV